ncbi:MAG: serine hydrolase domain-containing protein [Draconibacterium sp.]
MNKLLPAILAILLLNISGLAQTPASANPRLGTLANTTPEQSQLIIKNTLTFPEKTQLSIALIKNNNVIFTGIERIGDTLNYTDNSLKIFEIGSISKVFTSTLLANLVLSKKVGLNDTMSSCTDLPLNSRDTFTLRELANHTSGLPRLPANLNLGTADFRNPYKNYSEEDLVEYLCNDSGARTLPGEKYEYSNLGAGLLAYLLEKKAVADYETMLKKYIFKKYGMKYSSTLRAKLDEDLVPGRDAAGNETPNWDFNVLAGAGGILSNVHDLTKFVQAQFNPSNTELTLPGKVPLK